MITIYHLLESRSSKIIWLMEELGEPYEIEVFKRQPNMMAPAPYRALHQTGTSPIANIDGYVMVETGAIAEYILHRYGKGRLTPKPDFPDYARYIQFLHYAEGSAALSFLTEAVITRVAEGNAEPSKLAKILIRTWSDRTDRIVPYLDDELSKRAYFAGAEFTAADIMMAGTFGNLESFLTRPVAGRALSDYKNIARYRAAIAARPAYQRALKIADPEGDVSVFKRG